MLVKFIYVISCSPLISRKKSKFSDFSSVQRQAESRTGHNLTTKLHNDQHTSQVYNLHDTPSHM